ncbi:PTS system D-glucosamine-specific IIC component [Melghirimyces profundicolus]|uniref:PTS system D-glucosamine-specific IIC component n=1 Tax=Melghirimyces profundicolus TaxID=1242148 RepID=A0A2T6BGW3_9BACL|nr:PTS transporter subunit EIIC [Melghirimyces profundicolus]PTX55304.1 PTS system D-glucosamine-specific IIC component [Melghirimyces profundicolus]
MLKSRRIPFDFFQRVGRSMMAVVLILPLVSILMGLGGVLLNPNVHQILPFLAGDGFQAAGELMQRAGQAVFNNLPVLFAVAIAITWTGAGMAGFASLIAFFIMHTVLGALIDITGLKLNEKMMGDELGIETMQTGVFGGILIGFLTAWLYNKFHRTELPDAISLFSGERLVPIIASFAAIGVAVVFYFIWPAVGMAILTLGQYVATHTNPLVVGLYGGIEKLLIPFGLHHIYNTPLLFTEIGAHYETLDGSRVVGDQNVYIAQVIDKLRDPSVAITGGTYIAGKFIPVMFGLPAAALAMIRVAREDRKAKARSLLIAAAVTAFLTGITEPLEFTFLFVAPLLYGVHALLTGLAFGLANFLGMKAGFAGGSGLIDFVLFNVLPNPSNAWILTIGLGLVFGVVYYFVFRTLILARDLKTPGREEEGEETRLFTKEEAREKMGITKGGHRKADEKADDSRAARILTALGGKGNITKLDACISRLRVGVKDRDRVDEAALKQEGASGVLRVADGVQAVFGTRSSVIKEEIRELLEKEE